MSVEQTFANDISGILPLGKVDLWHHWLLAGGRSVSGEQIGQPKHDCGTYYMKGCLEGSLHKGDHAGKGYFLPAQRTCKRGECPTCYNKWAGREANRAMRRMAQFKTRFKPIHVVISPSVADASVDYSLLRDKMYDIAQEVGVIGGLAIIHPFRSLCRQCQKDKDFCECYESVFDWYVSPHFHLVCYGWIKGEAVGSMYEREGWVVKNLGLRDSVVGTIAYQLSHAGVHHAGGYCPVHGLNMHEHDLAQEYPFGRPIECRLLDHETKKHTIVWFGALSYNKLKVDKSLMDEKEKCPLCEGALFPVVFVNYDIDYEQFKDRGEFFADVDGWEYSKFRPPDPPEQEVISAWQE